MDDEALVLEICTELTIHSMLEEEIFYPACQSVLDDEEPINEAYVEHDGAKVLIAELMDSEADDTFFTAKVTVLSEMIKHHVAEEEETLFPEAEQTDLDMLELGQKMLERKEELIRQGQTAPARDAQLHGPQAGSGRAYRGGLVCTARMRRLS